MLSFLQYLKIYLLSLPVYLVIDGLWLMVVAKGFYGKYLGHLMTDKPNWYAAAIFYLGYMIGVIIFAVSPALRENSLEKAILWGALFGLFCYATYDLTNLTTVKNFPWFVAVIDILWGTLVTGIAATIAYLIGRKLI